jgi:hypothetical protein
MSVFKAIELHYDPNTWGDLTFEHQFAWFEELTSGARIWYP